MNYQQIVSRINDLYPHGETSATILNHINSAQDELSAYFGKTLIDSTLVTVASQDEYAFPPYLSDVNEIKFVDVGNSATPVDRFDYTRYCFVELEDGRPSGTSFYQIYSSTGAKSLGLYPVPSTAGLPIRITFQKNLTNATSATLLTEPEFDSRYHDLLVYYGCYMVCSSGASPDTIQADSFFKKWEEGLEELWKFKMKKDIETPVKRRDNGMWYR